jgi:hypothetical protein
VEYAVYRLFAKIFGVSVSDQIPLKRHGLDHVETYDVTAEQLERLEKECGDVGTDFQMAQFCFTLASSFFIALLTTKIESPKTFMVFVIVVIVGFIFALFFTTRWIRSRGGLTSTIKKIKSLQIGPVGEEGKEIRAEDLADLPAQQSNEAAK